MALEEGDVAAFCVHVGAGELRVVLTWTDYPADIGASPALVNDLDLTVRYVMPPDKLDFT